MSMSPSLLASTRATMDAAEAADTAMPSRFSDSSSSPAVMNPSPSWRLSDEERELGAGRTQAGAEPHEGAGVEAKGGAAAGGGGSRPR